MSAVTPQDTNQTDKPKPKFEFPFEIKEDQSIQTMQTAREKGFRYAAIAEDGSASCFKNLIEFAQFCNHYDISGCSFWELF